MSNVAHLGDTKFIMLVESFPSLVGRPGVDPWNALELDRSVTHDGWRSGGNIHAVQFVLSVWDPHYTWEAGPFNVVKAFQIWDMPHQRAFVAWAQKPWWP